jgi:hypothetical protein
VSAQQAEPVEDVRIAAKLPERAHAWVARIEIVQKMTPGALILTSRFGSERSGERLGCPPEDRGHGIPGRRKPSVS